MTQGFSRLETHEIFARVNFSPLIKISTLWSDAVPLGIGAYFIEKSVRRPAA
jgi:hypothetical protein